MVDSMKRGIWVGLRTTWNLGKFIFPITLIMTVLQYTVRHSLYRCRHFDLNCRKYLETIGHHEKKGTII
jgi:hypothetical protein